ncbi:hypothetical protein BC937DRAFT_88903, partial [Endogone sp. FLAS-F59071]
MFKFINYNLRTVVMSMLQGAGGEVGRYYALNIDSLYSSLFNLFEVSELKNVNGKVLEKMDKAIKEKMPTNMTWEQFTGLIKIVYKMAWNMPKKALIIALLVELYSHRDIRDGEHNYISPLRGREAKETVYPMPIITSTPNPIPVTSHENSASNSQFNDILNAMKGIDTKIDTNMKEIKSEVTNIKSEVTELKSRVNNMEQNGVRTNNSSPLRGPEGTGNFLTDLLSSLFTPIIQSSIEPIIKPIKDNVAQLNSLAGINTSPVGENKGPNKVSHNPNNTPTDVNEKLIELIYAKFESMESNISNINLDISKNNADMNFKFESMESELNSIKSGARNPEPTILNRTDELFKQAEELHNQAEEARAAGDIELAQKLYNKSTQLREAGHLGLSGNKSAPSEFVSEYIQQIEDGGGILKHIANGKQLQYTVALTESIPLLGLVKAVWNRLVKDPLVEKELNKTGTLAVTFNVQLENQWAALGFSMKVTKETTREEWIAHWVEGIQNLNNSGYVADEAIEVDIKLTPIKDLKAGALDLETVTLTEGKDAGKLLVYAGGLRLNSEDGEVKEKFFYLTDYPIYTNDPWEASHQLLLDLCKETATANGFTIYVHNLGGFDGIYLLKPIVELLGPVGVLMDKSKDIISLTLPENIVLKDSLRIFPASLESLSKMFDVPIPKGELEYLSRDLISLLDVMNSAAEMLFRDYKFYSRRYSNITKISPPLGEKIIRSGYRGGATQVFKLEGSDLHYYDINSLYPYAMKRLMPHHYLGKLQGYEINLDTFFGFLDVVVSGVSVPIPVLQHQSSIKSHLSYPKGVFRGIYFAEELKQMRDYGYDIRIMGGYAFSSAKLFDAYVDHFYAKKLVLDTETQALDHQIKELEKLPETLELVKEIKALKSRMNSKLGERFLVKLFLNGLYGYFGRRSENLETKLITNDDLLTLEEKYRVLEIVYDPSEGNKKGRPALVNVAIAAATTAESRMIINPYKVNPDNPCYYSDTDSVFLAKPLEAKHIGTDLGLMKDELKGNIIQEALFVAPKCYGYKTSTGKEVVVIAGFKRGDITWGQFKSVAAGGSVSTTRDMLRREFKGGYMRSVTQTKVLTKHDLVDSQVGVHAPPGMGTHNACSLVILE